MNWFKINAIVILATLFFGCQSHSENTHEHDNAAEEHSHDAHQHQEEDADEHEGHQHDSLEQETHPHDEQEEDAHIEYSITKLTRDTFYKIIHVSGKVMPAQGEEYLITATHTGLIIFKDNRLLEGTYINKNQVLMTLSTDELIHDNIEAGYIEAKNNFENAEHDYLRAKELNKEKIIPDKEFQDAQARYQSAKKEFELIRTHYTAQGRQVDAHQSGYIKELFVNEGEYVSAGAPLVKLTRNKRLVLKAEVPQRYFNLLPQVHSATFKMPYDEKIYSTEELNGEVMSYGKTTSGNSLFTPLFIEVDNRGNLLAGSFIEMYLKTEEIPASMVIPKSAILEEMGRHYVYAEHDGEFEKKYIVTGGTDGEQIEVLEGLRFGERIVTKNPYKIKLASLSSELPAHSHTH